MYSISVLTLVLCEEMIMGSCDVKLEGSLLKDLVELLIKKESDKGCMLLNRKRIPAFSAVLTKSKSFSENEIIKFDKVFTNNLNGYNPSTGIFTAPIAGIYRFSSMVMNERGKPLVVSLWHNNTRVTSVSTKVSDHTTGTLSIQLDLNKGDHIAVRSYYNYIIYSSNMHDSTFSGNLIAQ
ncbi:complement C1q tumor necrosis factor-related protein 2-like [Mytilus trossulus]|uniref:complement C1q tumor necrosis factor-related protein 2-like n=1 Tax=Mytilus trossulus TaxID=6551 RepID=UPI0030069755